MNDKRRAAGGILTPTGLGRGGYNSPPIGDQIAAVCQLSERVPVRCIGSGWRKYDPNIEEEELDPDPSTSGEYCATPPPAAVSLDDSGERGLVRGTVALLTRSVIRKGLIKLAKNSR